MNLSLEERMIKGDQSFRFGNLTVLIHENDYPYFNGTILDYVIDDDGKGHLNFITSKGG